MAERTEMDLVVRRFHGGPADGDVGEVPARHGMPIWRFVRGVGYCRYAYNALGIVTFQNEVLADERAMAEWVGRLQEEAEAEGERVSAYLHGDAKHPHSRTARFTSD